MKAVLIMPGEVMGQLMEKATEDAMYAVAEALGAIRWEPLPDDFPVGGEPAGFDHRPRGALPGHPLYVED